jgi:Ca2+-binding RTX toxin-like protein
MPSLSRRLSPARPGEIEATWLGRDGVHVNTPPYPAFEQPRAEDSADSGRCACPLCSGASPSDPQFFMPAQSGVAGNGLPIYSYDQAAVQLARQSSGWGAGAVVTYGFRANEPAQMPGVTGFVQFNAQQIAMTIEALALWAEVANITFVRVADLGEYTNSATMLFSNYTSGAGDASAFAYYPGASANAGDVWVNFSLETNNSNLVEGEFGPHTISHEIGHAIGLAHPGNYDASDGVEPSYPSSAVYWQDSRMYTVMSYFGSAGPGGSLNAFSSGPQLHDIAATQLLYGANMNTRTGDTVYGFNSNTGHEHFTITADGQSPVFSIWDAGGNDTINFSGYSTPTEIDLREMAFSSAGPGNGGNGIAIGNISIARGAVIENAIGGVAADTIIGNSAANVLNGGGGDDVIDGAGASDTLSGGGGADTLSGGDGDDVLYGHSVGATGQISAVRIASGLSQPVAAATAPGDAGFIYVAEKASGVIHRIDVTTGARTTFLDIPNAEFLADGERGVLGLAFHPDYASNGRYFVFLTDSSGDLQVREYHRSANPSVSDLTYSIVWETPHPGASNHNGGWIGFSPVDGFLYIATGDGGGGGDPNNNAQNVESLLGKILRIDVNGDDFPADPNRNYAIPTTNPFGSVAGADEIWAIGVRNPWRNSFDPRDGSLYIADVGQSAREEVNFLTAGQGGANLGWRIMEGDVAFNPGPPGTPQPGDPSLTVPIYAYPRSIGTTITGGEVYVGPNGDFVGQYVFADFGSNRIFTLQVVNGAASEAVDRTPQIVSATGPLTSIVEFVTGSDGALYAVGIGGSIWRLDMGQGAEDLGDTLSGGAGNDTLDGGLGSDTMSGGTGNDQYVVDNSGDAVTELSGEGRDTVFTSIQYTLGANVEDLAISGSSAALNIYGNALANLLVGNGAQNTLDGGAGADTLIGQLGDDLYVIDDIGDVIIENANEGRDTIYTAITFYQMGDNVEDFAATSNAGSYVVGNSVNNLMVGLGGADTLIGGLGADTLVGALGDDVYIIADLEDVIIESAGQGRDTIYTSIAFYQMGDNVEDLSMTGTSGTYAIGNSVDNLIVGNLGADTLDGRGGGDFMVGGAGDDIYFVDDLGDRTVESASEGRDTIYASISWTTGDNVEDLALQGSANINANGNALSNLLVGNSGNNILTGGGAGDVLVGGAGADTFVYTSASEGGDAITDFVSGLDHISISAAGFGGGLVNGAAASFASGSNPTSVGASFLYDTDDGRLFWDVDGAGGAAAILIATLSGAPALTQSDLIIGP